MGGDLIFSRQSLLSLGIVCGGIIEPRVCVGSCCSYTVLLLLYYWGCYEYWLAPISPRRLSSLSSRKRVATSIIKNNEQLLQ